MVCLRTPLEPQGPGAFAPATPWWAWVYLPVGEKSFTVCLAVSTEYQRVTDRRTDIFPQHSPRYAYASRGNNGRRAAMHKAES